LVPDDGEGLVPDDGEGLVADEAERATSFLAGVAVGVGAEGAPRNGVTLGVRTEGSLSVGAVVEGSPSAGGTVRLGVELRALTANGAD
jgi:hypothetical protein